MKKVEIRKAVIAAKEQEARELREKLALFRGHHPLLAK